MKKLFLFILLFVFTGFLTHSAFADNTPVIKGFQVFFGPGYFTGIAQIYDADNNLLYFTFGDIYGIKFNGKKVKLGTGASYKIGKELHSTEKKGVYLFKATLPDPKITDFLLYIVCVGTARDADGNVTIKKIRGYPAILIPDFQQRTKNIKVFPNPFNPTTTIKYSINAPTQVNLTVYNILGQQLSTLVNTRQNPGQYTVKFNGTNLPSGIYIIKLNVGNAPPLTRKIQLIK